MLKIVALEQLVKRLAGSLERGAADDVGPVLLDGSDPVARSVQRSPSALGRMNELGSAVGGIGAAFQVAQALEVVDQFGGRRRAQLCSPGEFGQAHAVNAKISEDLQVRLAKIAEAGFGSRGQHVAPELSEQPDEYLPDGESVGREIA